MMKMPHRFKTVDPSEETEIRALLASVDRTNPLGEAAALQALKEIMQQPEASDLSPEVLDAIRKALAGSS